MKKILSVLLSFALVFTCFSALFTVSAYEVDVNSPLYQKSVLFVGDSICEAIYERNNNEPLVGWAGRIIAWNGMTGYNAGISGASLSTCRGTNRIINQLSRYVGQNFDYVILEGGVNDAWDSVSLGAMTAGFNDNYDSNTFAGALEEAFKYTKENFPNATMGFIISFQMPAASYGKLSDMSEYFTLAKQICNKWGVPYLDFYFDQNFNDNILKPSTTENLYDYIHPNTEGYEILSPRINSWMKTLTNVNLYGENIALGKDVSISATGTGYGNYTADLTDGNASYSTAYDNSWFAFYNGILDGKNTVDGVGTAIIDLGGRFDISKARVFVRNESGSGISAPEQVSVSVSEDGNSYTAVGNLSIDYTDNVMYWAELTETATGRYIKFDFTVASNFVFLNEIEVYGVTAKEPAPVVMKGDLNGNDEIDSVDYTLLRRVYFNTYTADLAVTDINGNGDVDSVDYTLLKRAYFGTYAVR